jgi:hypothetical protein
MGGEPICPIDEGKDRAARKLKYDVTASNADGGTPTPPQQTKIA